MEKEQILQQLFSQTKEDKDILLEQLVFCKFANEYDFENYFRIGKLKESDLFCLISFLYHQDCFLMMLDIMNRYRDRFVSHDESLLKELDFSEQFMSRIEKIKGVAKNMAVRKKQSEMAAFIVNKNRWRYQEWKQQNRIHNRT